MFRGVWGPLIGSVTLVAALASGYWGGVAPQAAVAPELLAGGVVVAVSLLCISLAFIVVTITENDTWLVVFGAVALAVFVVMVPIYTSSFLTLTTVIESPDGSVRLRTVRGYAYTSEAKTALFEAGGQLTDDELIHRLGSVRRVWTEESIFEYWRILLNLYTTTAAALVCAAIFLTSFVDFVLLDRYEAMEALERLRKQRRSRAHSRARRALREAAASAAEPAAAPAARRREPGELPDPDDVLRSPAPAPASRSTAEDDVDPTTPRDPGKRWLGGR